MKDPQWIKKCLLIGLFSIIPIAGALNALGWMATFAETRLNGGTDLPNASLDYMGRGWRVFLSMLPIFGVLIVVAIVMGILGAIASHIHVHVLHLLISLGSTIIMLVIDLFFAVAMPAIIYLHVIKGEPWASLQFGKIINTIKVGGMNYFMFFIAIFIGGIIGELGAIACGVGLLVTMPMGQAIYGAALAEFARANQGRD